MTTVGDVIDAAGRKISLGSGMNATEKSDAIEALNMMLSQWSASPNSVHAVTRESFSITSSTASYTVGSGATIDTTWPSRIMSAFIRESDQDYPLLTLSSQEYAFTGSKSDTGRPAVLYHERTYPNGTFFFWPTPDSAYTVHLWSHKAFTTYSAIGDTISLPPEYMPALIYNLALEMAPEFGKEPSQVVVARAMSTFKTVKSMNNHPVPQVRTDVICGGPSSSKALFNGYYSDRVGSATLPFVLRS